MSFRWKPNEIKFLKENYKKMSYKEIGDIIGKEEYSVYNKCHNMGLTKMWKPGEDRFLKKNYNKMSNEEIGDYLGRSSSAVKARKHKLGLSVSVQDSALLDIIRHQRIGGFIC
jgi:DNA-binding CsgD family transcriptional regulator